MLLHSVLALFFWGGGGGGRCGFGRQGRAECDSPAAVVGGHSGASLLFFLSLGLLLGSFLFSRRCFVFVVFIISLGEDGEN